MARGHRRRRGHVPLEDIRPAPRLPGGCDDCAAYRTLEQHAPGVYVLLVHHDDTCPDYRAMRARRKS